MLHPKIYFHIYYYKKYYPNKKAKKIKKISLAKYCTCCKKQYSINECLNKMLKNVF